MIRQGISEAEQANGSQQAQILNDLAAEVENRAGTSSNSDKVIKLANTLSELAASAS